MADRLYEELVALREDLDCKREVLRAYEMANAASMAPAQRVTLDIAATRARRAWEEAVNLYNARLQTAAKAPFVPPKKKNGGEWCIGGCGDDGRCPHDPVCGN